MGANAPTSYEPAERCIRCHEDILEHGGGVQVARGSFVCWGCETPGEDLLEVAEQRLAAEAAAEHSLEAR